jgi:ferrochelatase
VSPTGVLALSYGTPASRGEVADYYTRIRHGRAPSDGQLADLVRRYDAIGGLSPLNERTADQVTGLAAVLERRAPGGYVVHGATKYASPSIEAQVDLLVAEGVAPVVGLVLAPLSAPMSTGQYHDRAVAALDGRADYLGVWSWWDAPGFSGLLAGRVREAIDAVGDEHALVVFSAHSLPARVVAEGSDYPDQLARAAERIATDAGIDDHLVCWQSAGRTADEWLGPDLLEVIRALDASVRTIVVCPVGFVADHLEVLYDVDIEARAVAEQRGITLRRTASLNDDPAFLEILADVVERAVEA